MADEGKQISFKELVDVRKEEMQGMLPGLMAEIKHGDKTVIVNSPNWLEKISLRMKGVDNGG